MLICKLLDYASKLSVIGWWLQINPQQTQSLILMIYTWLPVWLLLIPPSLLQFTSVHLMPSSHVGLTLRKEVQTKGCFLLMGAVQNT